MNRYRNALIPAAIAAAAAAALLAQPAAAYDDESTSFGVAIHSPSQPAGMGASRGPGRTVAFDTQNTSFGRPVDPALAWRRNAEAAGRTAAASAPADTQTAIAGRSAEGTTRTMAVRQ